MRPHFVLAGVALAGAAGCLHPVEPGSCRPGDLLVRECGTCGRTTAECVGGSFGPFGRCVEPDPCGPVPDCLSGIVETSPCGPCSEKTRRCVDGAWEGWSECTPSCAVDAGAWPDAGTSDAALAQCQDGDVIRRPCGDSGWRERICAGGQWDEWATCVEPGPDASTPPAPDASAEPDAALLAPDASVPPDAASPLDGGASDASAPVDAGVPDVGVPDAGECLRGESQTATCGSGVGACVEGTQSRSCTGAGHWGPWSACGGALVGPQLETCGNGLDDDCDGETDEGCQCNPASAGATPSFTPSAEVTLLLPDPSRCVMYGLSPGPPSQVLFFDTAQKIEIAQLALADPAVDLALSPDGTLLVAAHPWAKKLSVIDPATRKVTASIPLSREPYAIAVHDDARAFYVAGDQLGDLHRVSLDPGAPLDLKVLSMVTRQIAFSPDGALLYVGGSGLPRTVLYELDATSLLAPVVAVAETEESYGYGVGSGRAVAGASGRRVYYANLQYDARNVLDVLGGVQGVFAEDRAGLFALSTGSVLDAQSLRPLAALPDSDQYPYLSQVALAPGDLEVWMKRDGSREIHIRRVAELVGSAALGRRESAADASFFSRNIVGRLVHDPVRPLLYGAAYSSVVAISTATLQPVQEIAVGAMPRSPMSIDPAGDYLYVGSGDGLHFSQIDLRTFSFVRHVPAQTHTSEVAALAEDQVAYASYGTYPSSPSQVFLADASSGRVLATAGPYLVPELQATSGGAVLFVGDGDGDGSRNPNGRALRFGVGRGRLTATGTFSSQLPSSYYSSWERHLHAAPAGGPVFFLRHAFDPATQLPLYELSAIDITSLSPDGRLVLSKLGTPSGSCAVRRASDGVLLGTLPDLADSRQVISPDGSTLYYTTDGKSLFSTSLSGF